MKPHETGTDNPIDFPKQMTANELADYLDNNVEAMLFTEQPYLDKAATMLRKQHAEIMELRNSRDYWCLQYKDVMGKLDNMAGELMSLENSIRFEAGYGHN